MRKFYLAIYYLICNRLPNSYIPIFGSLSKKLRVFFCSKLFAYMGKETNICSRIYFGDGRNIKLGSYSGIGKNFKCQNVILEIGEYVMMGEEVTILGGGHNTSSLEIPMGRQGDKPKSNLTICDDVWIGTRVMILGNVSRIGKGAIIGAGSVVTKSVPDYAVVGGNPAKIIRFRNENQ